MILGAFGREIWVSEYYLADAYVIYTMRKEENTLIGWDLIEYLEPENSVLAEGWNFLNSSQKSPYHQILIEVKGNLASDFTWEQNMIPNKYIIDLLWWI